MLSVSAQTQIAPTLTPPGLPGKIAFTSKRDGHDQVYLMNPDGSGQTNVSQDNSNDSQPAWSPDGSMIAFASQREGNNEICIMNADGSNQKCLTHQPTPGKKVNLKLPQDYSPTWSPDGLHIAFVSTRTGNTDIWAVNIDGTNPMNLTQSSSNNDHPAWSPDLKSIAFVSDRDGNTEICVMDASGFNQRCLTNERTANRKPDRNKAADTYPAWSPDSQKLAFVSTREKNRNKQVFVMNADGSNPINVTQKISADDHPTWSPDGTLLAFMSNRDGLINDLYVTNLDGSNQTRATHTDKGGDFFPVWVPDGSHLTGTPTETLTPTPTGTIRFTPFPTDTPLPGGGQYVIPPPKTNTPVPVTATLYFPPPGPPNTPACNVTPFTVTNEQDYNDFNLGENPPQFATPDASMVPIPGSLRFVVATANLATAADGITRTVTFCPNVKHIVLLTADDRIVISQNMIIQGNAPQSPTVDGAGITSIFAVKLFGNSDVTATINNLTLVNGYFFSEGYVGGAISVYSLFSFSGPFPFGHAVLNNVTVSNSSGVLGGGIYVDSYSTLDATNSTITGNTATGNGGGVYVASEGTLVATNSTFTGNTASDSGGGIYGEGYCGEGSGGATITLNASTVSSNTSTNNGGGIYNGYSLTLNGSSVINNTDVSGKGAGIYNYQPIAGCSLPSLSLAKLNPSKAVASSAGPKGATIINSTIANNKSGGQGGAIYSNGPLTIQNSVITNNTAQNGGGVYITGGSYTLDSQSKISGNHASGGNPDSYVAPSVNVTNPTPTGTATSTATSTSTSTATSTPTSTATSTTTRTTTRTSTSTSTSTSTNTATATATYTATPRPTATHTSTPTDTHTPLPTATHTPLPSATHTPPPTVTDTPSATATNTPADTTKNN